MSFPDNRFGASQGSETQPHGARRASAFGVSGLPALLLLTGVVLGGWLGDPHRQASAAARDVVRALADTSAQRLQQRLGEFESTLARLARRPLVQALDPARCDPVVADVVSLNPDYLALELRDAQGNVVCSDPWSATRPPRDAETDWFSRAWRAPGLTAGGHEPTARDGERRVVLSYPVTNPAGTRVGLVVLQVDRLALGEVLPRVPKDAVITVADAGRTVLLHSAGPDRQVGTRMPAVDRAFSPDAASGPRLATRTDGVSESIAFAQLPGVGWQVAARLRPADVLADSSSILGVVGMAAGLLALGLVPAAHVGSSRSAAAAGPSAIEGERIRIARELHDDLQQRLVAIRMDLALLRERLPDAPHEVVALLEGAGESALDALDSTRRIINDMRPRALDDLELGAALESLASRFGRDHRIDCQAILDHGNPGVPGDAVHGELSTCLYRITQEALANVAQHAGATRVRIRLTSMGAEAMRLHIADNGRGMPAGGRRKPSSFGLMGMQERVQALGGVLRIESDSRRGTAIEAILPMRCHAEG